MDNELQQQVTRLAELCAQPTAQNMDEAIGIGVGLVGKFVLDVNRIAAALEAIASRDA